MIRTKNNAPNCVYKIGEELSKAVLAYNPSTLKAGAGGGQLGLHKDVKTSLLVYSEPLSQYSNRKDEKMAKQKKTERMCVSPD